MTCHCTARSRAIFAYITLACVVMTLLLAYVTDTFPKSLASSHRVVHTVIKSALGQEFIKSCGKICEPFEKPQVVGEAKTTQNQENAIKPGLQIIYKNFSKCAPRPAYLEQYRAHCWATCHPGYTCDPQDMLTSVRKKNATLHCFPNLHLIRLRKCGTSDLKKWFDAQPQIITTLQDYWPNIYTCPKEYFIDRTTRLKATPTEIGGHYFNTGPGNLICSRRGARNGTHIEVITTMQLFGYMATPATRFYVQLRNPTDRAMSYLFYWHKLGLVYHNKTFEDMNGDFVDQVMRERTEKLKHCISELGELGCVYTTDGHDGNMDALLLHSLYVVYIEEAFKFIPRDQIMFKTMQEYSKDEVSQVKEVSEKFFGVPKFQVSMVERANQTFNVGKKNPVWKTTLVYLDKFFEPYIIRLAKLLGDDKWLFKTERKK